MYLELKQGAIESEAISIKFLCLSFITEEWLQASFKLLKTKKTNYTTIMGQTKSAVCQDKDYSPSALFFFGRVHQ